MSDVAKVVEIVFDCRQAPVVARFWAAVLDDYEVRPYDEAEIERLAALGLTPDTDPIVIVDGPGPTLCFQQVDETKRTKNRVHLDVEAADRQAEVNRLVQLGASVQQETQRWTTMLDPEGNEFCVLGP